VKRPFDWSFNLHLEIIATSIRWRGEEKKEKQKVSSFLTPLRRLRSRVLAEAVD
jgi:hypothetical protein